MWHQECVLGDWLQECLRTSTCWTFQSCRQVIGTALVLNLQEYKWLLKMVLHETEPQIGIGLAGTGWTTWRTCVRRSWWRGWRPPTQLIFSGLINHKLKQALPFFCGMTQLFHKNINKIPAWRTSTTRGPSSRLLWQWSVGTWRRWWQHFLHRIKSFVQKVQKLYG